MYLQDIQGVLDGQFVTIKYDCSGGFERCGKEWNLKLKDAKKNAEKNNGSHICRQCQLKSNNPGTRPEVKAKIKQTINEKYNGVLPLNNEENTKKRNEKMFGTQEAIDARSEKTKQTNLEKFGVEHPMFLDEIKEKQKLAMRENHGVDHPLQSPKIKEKKTKTCRDVYGVDNVMQVPEIAKKQQESTEAIFGVKHYNQLPEMKEYMSSHCAEWLSESWKSGWQIGKPKSEEQKQKQRETVSRMILNGNWKGGYNTSKKGLYFPSNKCGKNIVTYRSSQEAIYNWFLDMVDTTVEFYEPEPLRIEYEFEGTHFYIPDFIIKYKTGEIVIKEIKADFLMDDLRTLAKIEAGKKHCEKNNVIYEVVSYREIEKLNIDYYELIELDCFQPFSNEKVNH